MVYESDRSIPRIHVQSENGQIVCILDRKLQQRYGPVLLSNNKQGRHLFSISYCLASMAANFCYRPEHDILQEITSQFHLDFLTKLIINSKFLGPSTYFLSNWELNFNEMATEFEELQSSGSLDSDVLENYLNQVGAMLHVLPCNVAHSDNASDPEGGIKAREAIDGIRKICSSFDASRLNRYIGLTIDGGVIEELFRDGFDANNTHALAFIMMQVWELQSLQNRERPSFVSSQNEMNNLRRDISRIVFQPHAQVNSSAYTIAFHEALKSIRKTRDEVVKRVASNNHQSIKSLIQRGIDYALSRSNQG